jgi:hypothetical protein
MIIQNGLFMLMVLVCARCAPSPIVLKDDYHFISFRLAAAKIPMVKGKLNGRDAWFIVDTGASVTLINKAIIKHFGLSERFDFYEDKTEINGLGGRVGFESFVCKIEIGILTINHAALKSKDLNGLFALISGRENIRITGIIGSDILSQYGISINYENKTLSYKVNQGSTVAN